jgi:hypothetical protein
VTLASRWESAESQLVLILAAYAREKAASSSTKGGLVRTRETQSVNDIRTAIRELSTRAELARKEGRPDDAAELDRRVQYYREELGARP